MNKNMYQHQIGYLWLFGGGNRVGRNLPPSTPLFHASFEAIKCVVCGVTLAAYVPPLAWIHFFNCSMGMERGGVEESLMSPARAMVRFLRTPIVVGGKVGGL